MLGNDFFARDGKTVARDLIGCFLVVEVDDRRERLQIIETESYGGSEDIASHARFGPTDRTEVMWAKSGTLYVYLSYGIHHMLNIVTGEEGDPQAVLVRGAGAYDGPGKLTKALGITKEKLNKQKLGEESGIWIETRDPEFDPRAVVATPRIGIDSATKEWGEKPLRFMSGAASEGLEK